MPRFNKIQSNELKNCLYFSHIHDALFEEILYNADEKSLSIKVINQINEIKYNITFFDVKLVLGINDNKFGNNETILSLTIEDDYSFMRNIKLINDKDVENCIYLVFQMFSGNELHIISTELQIQTG